MAERIIPDEVRRFILTSIPSVPYLEALLLLRSTPGSAWDPVHVARRLYIGEAQASEILEALAQAGIASRDVSQRQFAYAPGDPEISQTIDALAQTYATSLIQVSDLIHSRLGKQAQRFADAFRWKKDDR